MMDLVKLRYVTEHYSQLQGLRLVPLGTLFLAAAAWHHDRLRWIPGAETGGSGWFIGGLGLAVLAAYGVGLYYRRLFGCVQPRAFRTGGPSLFMNAVIVFTLLVLQDARAWPLDASVLYVALVLAYTGVVHDGLRSHYLCVALACLLFASARSFGVPEHTRQVMFDLLIGGGLMTAGIGDHLVLRKVLHSPSRHAHVDATI